MVSNIHRLQHIDAVTETTVAHILLMYAATCMQVKDVREQMQLTSLANGPCDAGWSK